MNCVWLQFVLMYTEGQKLSYIDVYKLIIIIWSNWKGIEHRSEIHTLFMCQVTLLVFKIIICLWYVIRDP